MYEQLITWTTISYFAHLISTYLGLKRGYSEKAVNHLISSQHALVTFVSHALIIYYNLIAESNLYYLSIGYSMGYYLNDLTFYYLGLAKNPHLVALVFHHFISIGFLLFGNYQLVHNHNQLNYFYSRMYLAEASTPLLHYIQHHGAQNVSPILGLFFVFTYFICRPINLTYVYYYTTTFYPITHPLPLSVLVITLLNYYWFYRICVRAKSALTPKPETKTE